MRGTQSWGIFIVEKKLKKKQSKFFFNEIKVSA